MLINPQEESSDLHGPDRPIRAARDLRSTLANPDVRLANTQDLKAINARRSLSGTVTWPCTPLAEATRDGSCLKAVAFAGLAVSVTDRRRHTMVVGATGSGKTYNFAIPAFAATLRETNESVVFTNLKGPSGTEEVRALVTKLAPDAEVVVFAPGDRTRSIGCNFIAVARQHKLLGHLVRFLCSTMPKGIHDCAFYEKAATKAINAALRHERINSIAALHQLFSDLQTLEAFAKETGDPDLLAFAKFLDSGSNGSTSGFDVSSRIAPLDVTDDIRAVTSGPSEFDPGTTLESGNRFVLIVEANENDLENALHVMGLFFTLFFACAVQAAESNGGVLARPVTFFLDEFGVMPPIPDFHKTANLGRSRGFSFHVFVQSVEQVFVNYGASAGAVLAALCTKVFLCSGLGATDREYASRLAGSIAVQEWRECQQLDPHSDQWLSATRSSHVTIRPLIAADDLILRPHPIFGGYAYVFLVDQAPLIVHFTSSFEIPAIADAINASRTAPPPKRETPLPAVPSTGLLASVVGASTPAKSCGVPAGITNSAGWTDDRLRVRLEQVKKESLDWDATTGSARKWWCAFEDENQHRLALVLRLGEELAVRKATITEFFLAYVYSNSDNIQANLHYLDYTRLKKHEEQKKREAAAAHNDESATSDHSAPPAPPLSDASPKKRKNEKPPDSPLAFVRCASCRSLAPASASTCRHCGESLPKP